jgi:anti-anti-sigma factor
VTDQRRPADDPDGRTGQRRFTVRRSGAAGPAPAPAAERRFTPSVARTPELTGGITVEEEAGGHVLHLAGDVDAPVLQQFTRERPLDQLRILAVDVGALRYIDSAGLSFLARWAQSARADGRPAEMRRMTPRFAHVLEVSGLIPLFDLT